MSAAFLTFQSVVFLFGLLWAAYGLHRRMGRYVFEGLLLALIAMAVTIQWRML